MLLDRNTGCLLLSPPNDYVIVIIIFVILDYVWHSLFLKHTLPVATRVGRRVLRIFWYCKTKQRQKQATYHHNINSAETKDSFYITWYKLCPTGRADKSPASIARGTDLGRGTILGTLPLLNIGTWCSSACACINILLCTNSTTELEGLGHEFVERFIELYKTLSSLWRVARNTTFITKKESSHNRSIQHYYGQGPHQLL